MNYNIYTDKNTIVSSWLLMMCLLIILMICIGGVTRLTDAGLSITEWNPLSGIIPPLTESAWIEEFEKYKKSPEYIKINFNITFNEFKSIYITEFVHRIFGRLVGILYIFPFVFFLWKGKIKLRESGVYLLGIVLLLAQGFMGWYMVKSGLSDKAHVSHYRLALHLLFAILLYMVIFWQYMKFAAGFILLPSSICVSKTVFLFRLSIFLLLIQITLGALVAGLDAGLVYNSFPLMGDSFIPDEIMRMSLSISVFSEPVFVQFIHRMMAYILSIVVITLCINCIKLDNRKLNSIIMYVFITLIVQIFAGIITIIYHVPILIALLHQLGAIILLSFLIWGYFLIKTADND